MSLAIDYCKEIATELKVIPVYLPGTPINLGDIIEFKETNIFGTPQPLGPFTIIGNLTDLPLTLDTLTEPNPSPDSYLYASKNAVSVAFTANAQAGDAASGKLTVGFSKEGATYLSALDCTVSRFKSILNLESQLAPFKDKYDWNSFFIVTAITTAAKALVMQSSKAGASLAIDGQVKALQPSPGPVKNLDANIAVTVNAYNEASFFKDWSADVAVFFTLARYHKKFLGSYGVETALGFKTMDKMAPATGTGKYKYTLEEVDPGELDLGE